jgi:predicted Zn finger-like uncharacterized protein
MKSSETEPELKEQGMIATCTNCQARYQLEDAKVPKRIVKVRCPACSGVFSLDGSQVAALVEPEAPASVFGDTPKTETPAACQIEDNQGMLTSGFQDLPESPIVDSPVAPTVSEPASVLDEALEPADSAPATGLATLDEPAPATGKGRRRRCKEEMLARALVSDILVYNRETRDAGIAEGNLLESLGGEIKKSWELYKEKVTPEVANSTTYFREALNEILADGDQVF